MANVLHLLRSDATSFVVMASAARTTAPDTQEFEVTGRQYEYRGVVLVLDVTAVTATPALAVVVTGVDRISGKTYPILTSATVATAVATPIRIAPGLTTAANIAGDYLPPVFRVAVTHGNADSATYSVSGMLI